MSLTKQIDSVNRAKQLLEIKQQQVLEKALRSSDPTAILKAREVVQGIEHKRDVNPKAFFIDPLEFNTMTGYKNKPYTLSYTTLKRMAKTPIINSIIKTRKNQIADFAEPQADRYSTGFVIQKKAKNGEKVKMDRMDKKIANYLTDFILKCGNEHGWQSDDFDTFTRKVMDDSLTYDQMTFEVIRNRKGQVEQFLATDASTFRIADSYFDTEKENPFFLRQPIFKDRMQGDGEKKPEPINGYYPAYVQVYQTMKVNDFYPWELCFGVRNPTTSIDANGYGTAELEDLINVVTSMLWGDEYNRRFFSQGSAPKGLLKVKGTVNEASLQQFRQQWQAMISGVMQSWKTPIVEGDIDWVDLQKNNRDMEYVAWIEYLIKIACAIYNIDPSEIGWDISRSGGSSLFEGDKRERLQHSKDKGLYPILKFYQRKLNKYVIEQINPDFELAFMGLNGMTIEQELEMDIKKVGSFAKINEIRDKWEMSSLGEDGEIIENAVYIQNRNAAQMSAMGEGVPGASLGSNEQPKGGGTSQGVKSPVKPTPTPEVNPFDEEAENYEKGEDDIFVKAFDNFLKEEMEDGK